jgi:hypothetical protein
MRLHIAQGVRGRDYVVLMKENEGLAAAEPIRRS